MREFPDILKLEAEMRPLLPGEEDQIRKTRKQITRVITTTYVKRVKKPTVQDDKVNELDVSNGYDEQMQNGNVGKWFMAYFLAYSFKCGELNAKYGQGVWFQWFSTKFFMCI